MTPKIPILKVYGHVDATRVFLGDLSFSPRLGGAFQWSKEALDLNLEWSPLHCTLSRSIWTPQNDDITILDGIPGFIHDALPDGWGMLLMDRMFTKKKIAKSDITPLLRLSFFGRQGMGSAFFRTSLWR